MTKTIKYVWNVLNGAIKTIDADDKKNNLIISCKDFEFFKETFNDLYNEILNGYMDERVNHLDRHKVAAIIIISILKTIDIKYKDLPKTKVFWGKQTVAINIGLNYMCGELNKILTENGWDGEIEKFDMPNAISCDTSFEDIMIRNLVYAEDNPEWGLNPLAIAEDLFLLEYITIIQKGIDFEYLSHDKKKNIKG